MSDSGLFYLRPQLSKLFFGLVVCTQLFYASVANAQSVVSPTALAFGSMPVGKTLDKLLTVTAGAVDVAAITLTAPSGFSIVANGCGALLAGKSCTATVRFTPTVATSYISTLKITADATTLYVDLTGTGTTSTPGGGTLSASTTALDFGAVRTNTSRTLQFTLSASVANVKVSAVNAPTGFSATHSCDPVVLVGKSCTVNVTFSPSSGGNFAGTLGIDSDAATSPTYVSVSGAGGSVQSADVPPLLALDLSSYDFGSLVAGETRSFKFVLTNVGGQTLNNSLALTGQGFSVASGGCYTSGTISIAPGAACELTVRFLPSASGSYTGSLALSGVGSTNAVINLTGRATGGVGGLTNPVLNALTTSVDFGTVPVGSSVNRSVGLLANATGVSVTNISVPAGFAVTHDCDSKLPTLGYCTLSVIFTPASTQKSQGYIVVTTSSGYATFISVVGQGGGENALSVQPTGSPEARTVTAYYRFNEQYQGRSGNLYVALVYQGRLYFLSGASVTAYVEGSEPPAYATGPYQATDITVFNSEDLRQYAGASVYLGYGASIKEVLDNQQYSLVYTLH